MLKLRVSALTGWCRCAGLDCRQAMAIEPPVTAMLSVLALETAGITPDRGPVLVNASGGVGSVATALLAARVMR